MQSDGTPLEPQCQVRFTTRDERWRVTDAPIDLPTRLTRAGLSEVVNHLLSGINPSHTPRPFDFLLEGELLRGTVAKGLLKHKLSGEAAAVLEYVECVPPPRPERTCAHEDWLCALAAHPGAAPRLLLAACYDHAAYVWDAQGQQRAALAGHTAPVTAVDWLASANGGAGDGLTGTGADGGATLRAATGSKDHTVRTWRLDAPRKGGGGVAPVAMTVACEASLVGHTSSVEAVAANPAGDNLCSGSWEGELFLWGVSEQATASARAGGAGAPDAPAPTSKRAKGARGDAAPTATAPMELSPSARLQGHSGAVSALCWPTAALVYSGSWDGTIREWQVDVESTTATLGGQAAVSCLDVSLASTLIASGHTDHTVRLWDSRLQQAALRMRLPHKGWVAGVRWCPNAEHLLATACYDGCVRLFDVRSSVPLHQLKVHEGKALCVAWDGADRLASGGSDAQLRQFALDLPEA